MQSKNTYSAEYKSKLVIEVLEGGQTVNEIAARESINVNMLKNWKREFLKNAANAFNGSKSEKDAKKEAAKAKEREEELMKTIGQLTVEVNWLKKNLMNTSDPAGRRNMVSKNEELTVSEQCRLLEVNRTTFYYKPVKTVDEMLEEKEYLSLIHI